MVTDVDARLAELGIDLPPVATPVASYIPVRLAGGLAFVSGQVAMPDGEVLHPGKLGGEVSVEQGQESARRCALQALSALRATLGSLDRVSSVAQVTVYVASAPGFTQQAAVANGASDLLVEVFGEAGKHTRAAVGMAELPLGAPVEVSLVADIR